MQVVLNITIFSPRMVSHELFVSSSSLTGQNKACQNPEKVLSISLDRYIRPRSSLARTAPSLSTAGRHAQTETSNLPEDAKEHEGIKILLISPSFPTPSLQADSWGCLEGVVPITVASANQTHLPSDLGTARKAPDPLYPGERDEMLIL